MLSLAGYVGLFPVGMLVLYIQMKIDKSFQWTLSLWNKPKYYEKVFFPLANSQIDIEFM
jgi:hypothetical protein